jgi:hypothetical protein
MNDAALKRALRAPAATAAQLIVIVWSAVFGNEPPSRPTPHFNEIADPASGFFVRID